ncbi:M15 family metallopeptidase [Chromobacterium sp. Beijing]|uniref:M15 family metallopeptidase n=1 Tax=Chromobacterium sp. Beijing TaxID=2735795 RepID=UPI001F389BDE|nr:M15 family metallopeptidase [Chromobacterium sp. Beijing]UJB31785.1 D-Ala-D-Ala dipeptidase [Chromobacterium sp. Beijing]
MRISAADHALVAIDFTYPLPDAQTLARMRAENAPCALERADGLFPENSYYRAGRKGCAEGMSARSFVASRLRETAARLAPEYGLLLFDAYRCRETQADLFQMVLDDVRAAHPDWDAAAVERQARLFAAHPDDTARFAVLPHNSGGAVDLAICRMDTGEICDFGTAFDAAEPASRTDFFEAPHDPALGFSSERWLTVRHNRRVLFNLMKQAGFSNYAEEWWHYDLGDCLWGQALGVDWIYPSMEAEPERPA